jgi:hypothetical protein
MMKIIVGGIGRFPSWSLGTREEAGAWESGETFDARLID